MFRSLAGTFQQYGSSNRLQQLRNNNHVMPQLYQREPARPAFYPALTQYRAVQRETVTEIVIDHSVNTPTEIFIDRSVVFWAEVFNTDSSTVVLIHHQANDSVSQGMHLPPLPSIHLAPQTLSTVPGLSAPAQYPGPAVAAPSVSPRRGMGHGFDQQLRTSAPAGSKRAVAAPSVSPRRGMGHGFNQQSRTSAPAQYPGPAAGPAVAAPSLSPRRFGMGHDQQSRTSAPAEFKRAASIIPPVPRFPFFNIVQRGMEPGQGSTTNANLSRNGPPSVYCMDHMADEHPPVSLDLFASSSEFSIPPMKIENLLRLVSAADEENTTIEAPPAPSSGETEAIPAPCTGGEGTRPAPSSEEEGPQPAAAGTSRMPFYGQFCKGGLKRQRK